jgi:predicted nucleic acid-binding Zn ribbon protein
VFDLFHAMSATPKVKCEQCKGRCNRRIGTGAGIIFKGSGFYETDFKDKKGTAPAKEGKADAKPADGKSGDGKSGGKSEAASATSSEKSPEKKSDSKSEKKAEKKAV